MEKKEIYSGGIGFCGLLTITFVVLKIMGVISWHWFWVISPLWLPLLLVIVIVAIMSLIFLLLCKKSNK